MILMCYATGTTNRCSIAHPWGWDRILSSKLVRSNLACLHSARLFSAFMFVIPWVTGIKLIDDMGQVTQVCLSCYRVLLSNDSKTRSQDRPNFVTWPIYHFISIRQTLHFAQNEKYVYFYLCYIPILIGIQYFAVYSTERMSHAGSSILLVLGV